MSSPGSSVGPVIASNLITIQPLHSIVERNRALKYLHTNKSAINLFANTASSVVNLGVHLNLNYKLLNFSDEWQELAGNFAVKCATGFRGVAGVLDCLDKNNPIPMIGFAMEPFVSILTNGFDHWVSRGMAQGINQMQSVYKRRGMDIEVNGQKIKMHRKDGDNFRKYGIDWKDAFKVSVKEYGAIWGEIFSGDWKDDKKFTNLITIFTTTQCFGPILYYSGLQQLGTFVRDLFGASVDAVYLFDKPEENEPSYFIPGLSWILSSMVDWSKRTDFISSKFEGLTQLSSAWDGVAGTYYGFANFGDKKVTHKEDTNAPWVYTTAA